MDLKTNPQLPIIGKELLKKLSSKAITMEEFDKECAYWMIKDLDTMYYRHNLEKPTILKDYEEEKKNDYKATASQEFWNKPEIREYTLQSKSIYNSNHGNWHWLHFMKKWIPIEDSLNHIKISKAIKSYPHYENGFREMDN